ncbi:MAG TPA: hypothetical protein VE715_08235 [Blastocatellia bacterium]|nr:hypothetical protein [Blastocatellia bacterium]
MVAKAKPDWGRQQDHTALNALHFGWRLAFYLNRGMGNEFSRDEINTSQRAKRLYMVTQLGRHCKRFSRFGHYETAHIDDKTIDDQRGGFCELPGKTDMSVLTGNAPCLIIRPQS